MRVDQTVTSGAFVIDGQSFDVDNNVWVVGDDDEVVVLDSPHDPDEILRLVDGRRVLEVVCTHAHSDHVDKVFEVADAVGAPIALHPDERVLWDQRHPDRAPDRALADGEVIAVGDARLEVILTPGHSPGGVCLYEAGQGVLFSGDTLFQGGPGATGRSHSDFPTIIASIRSRLLVLPADTVVHTGHGPDTTIGDEAPHLQEWIDRGH